MKVFTALAGALFTGAFALGVSACTTAPREPQVQAACYWMTPDGAGWQAMSHVDTKQTCFALDSCSGGLGQSGGGCYKWARGTEAPALAW